MKKLKIKLEDHLIKRMKKNKWDKNLHIKESKLEIITLYGLYEQNDQ